jgi:putative ABC transport system substrate-binding protein
VKTIIAFTLSVTLLLICASAEAQQAKKPAHICFIGTSASVATKYLDPFHKRLGDFGYVEGQNIAFEYRYDEGKVERDPELAAEIVHHGRCDVILTTGTEAAFAAKGATQTIPIVMAYSGDAVQLGIVADLARPGGNITGMTSLNNELSGKRLELLREVIPKLARVALLWNTTNPNTSRVVREIETVGRSLKVEIQKIEVRTSDEFDGAFRAAVTNRAEALMMSGGSFFAAHKEKIVGLAAKNRLPATYPNVQFVESGGLMAYTEDRIYMLRRAAEYVDKILKGAKPADLPVERPGKWEFVINLKTAKQIGLNVPQSVLYKADRVIK